MSSPTVYLVSGANRGIGFSLVSYLLTRTDVIVFAGARDPSKAERLHTLAQEQPGKFFVVKCTSGDVKDNEEAVKTIKEKAGKLDVVIANAGIVEYFGPVLSTPLSEFQKHFEVNTLGMVVLFQQTASLLLKSSDPKFILISTAGASMALRLPYPVGAYGGSKAFANFLLVKMSGEHENLITVAIHPGMVQSETGNTGAVALGMKEAPHTLIDSVAGIMKIVDKAEKKNSATFWDAITGVEIGW